VKLPILLSVPHAGWKIPPEVSDICILTEKDILEDGDGGASEIYYPLEEEVEAFVTTDIGRAIVDMNRAADDFWKDGVIKTHTCWDVPVYSTYPSNDTISKLIAKYHKPYHTLLSSLAKKVKIGIDCHTMAAVAPPSLPTAERNALRSASVMQSIPVLTNGSNPWLDVSLNLWISPFLSMNPSRGGTSYDPMLKKSPGSSSSIPEHRFSRKSKNMQSSFTS
jgi:hypothetical protein